MQFPVKQDTLVVNDESEENADSSCEQENRNNTILYEGETFEKPWLKMTNLWNDCFKRLSELPKLKSIGLVLDRSYDRGTIYHPLFVQIPYQRTIFQSLYGKSHELSVRNLWLNSRLEIEEPPEPTKRFLATLTSLRLAISHEPDELRNFERPRHTLEILCYWVLCPLATR